MNAIVAFCLIIAAVSSVQSKAVTPIHDEEPEAEWLAIGDETNHVHYLNLRQTVARIHVPHSDVTFHYTSRITPLTELNLENVDNITETDFDKNRRTMFIIHGWKNQKSSLINTLIVEAALKMEDWNLFVVDWNVQANMNYIIALGAVEDVGTILAKFIGALMAEHGLTSDTLQLVGHSLGAHIAGHAGAELDHQVPVIVGLDPASPFIKYEAIDKRLDTTDAKYVQIIHTSGGLLAFLEPVGHSDFFPNGGMNQKGCGLDIVGTCAHSRSYMYFAESIITGQFVATSCESRDDWKAGHCENNTQAHMGGNVIKTSVLGSYYLETSAAEPYALQ